MDGKIKIVLYGVLGSSSYCGIHSALAPEVQKGNMRYIYVYTYVYKYLYTCIYIHMYI
jgi:hypothetical protein